MTKLKVEEMSCNHCVQRINAALVEAESKHTVNLEQKLVEIDGCQNCVKKAIDELSDLGFTASIVES